MGILHSDDYFPQLLTDSVCLRQPTMDDIREAVRAVEKRRSDANDEIIVFDLSNNNQKRFNTNNYEEIYHRGRSAGRSSNG